MAPPIDSVGGPIRLEQPPVVNRPVEWSALRMEGSVFLGELVGDIGNTYEVQRSTNLVDWQLIATIVCPDGVVRFADKADAFMAQCFYRAVRKR